MLDKRSKKVLWIFGIALLGIVITELVRPKPIDWRPSYTAADKIPFGSFVLFEEINSLFKNIEIEKIQKDPYEFLTEGNYTQNSAYIFINDDLFFDERQADELLKYAENGNTVFVSSRSIGPILADSLKIESSSNYNILETEIHPKFFSPSLKQDSLYAYKKGVFKTFFNKIDTLKTTALGYYESENSKLEDINYIKVNFG